jgi:hypothetical protein
MTTHIDHTIMKMGMTEMFPFKPDCNQGDWIEHDIKFPSPFPNTGMQPPVVIITPTNNPRFDSLYIHGMDKYDVAPAVCIAQDVTLNGFTLVARNSDCGPRGPAAFNWLAILEHPEPPALPAAPLKNFVGASLRTGIIQSKQFQPDCNAGDWQDWPMPTVEFAKKFPGEGEPIILLTGSDLFVKGHTPAAVGIVLDASTADFSLKARNSDDRAGETGFYWVAAQNPPDRSESTLGRNLWVDTGIIPQDHNLFRPDGKGGDWIFFDQYFKKPFQTPPIVVATARYDTADSRLTAVVARAHKVTTHGFTLAGRNSDCAQGISGFNWAAFGCAQGCESYML